MRVSFYRREVTWLCVLACALAATGAVADARAQRGGAPRVQFAVEIEGLVATPFRDVSGIGIETEVVEVRDGGSNDVRKVPGRSKFPTVTLKRTAGANRDLYEWAASNATGKITRRNVIITMTDLKGGTIAKWTLLRAWPVKWEGPTFNAAGNEIAIETLELAHDGVTMNDK